MATVEFWRHWLDGSTYTGRWREMVSRSAMMLNLMTYAPTGGLVAAPTTGLPEQEGDERNWDYRYTWIRDGSFSIYALLGLGFTEEAAAFSDWLRDRASEQAGTGSGPLNIMYRVDGSSDLTEVTLDHLEGWRGPRPVRIGNGAAGQLQLDIYGEMMDAMFLADQRGVQTGHQSWLEMASLIDWLCEHWDQPDEGSGKPGAAARTSSTAGCRAGSRSTARSRWRPAAPARPTCSAGGPSGTRSTPRSSTGAGTSGSAPSASSTAARCSTPRC
jgi:GH15 family glucan-1,4-alpha-glucosidase